MGSRRDAPRPRCRDSDCAPSESSSRYWARDAAPTRPRVCDLGDNEAVSADRATRSYFCSLRLRIVVCTIYPTRNPTTAKRYTLTRMKVRQGHEGPPFGGGTYGKVGQMSGQSMQVHRLAKSLSAQFLGVGSRGVDPGGVVNGKFIWKGLPMSFSSPIYIKNDE